MIVVLIVLPPVAWVNNIAQFAFTYMLGNLLILLTMISVSVYCISIMLEKQSFGPNLIAYNPDGFWIMVGFAIYAYEGIGVVMPIMQASAEPDKFIRCLVGAIVTLSFLFLLFGLLTYVTFGSTLDKPFVTEMLPADNVWIRIIKILFCFNLVFSYPITINPTNTILEGYFFGGDPRRAEFKEKWMRRLSRFFVCFTATLLGIVLAKDMDKFLGLLGALLGSPLALMMPALVHLKLVAETRLIKLFDCFLIGLSIFTFAISTTMSANTWIESSKT